MTTQTPLAGLTLAFDTSSRILDVVLTDGTETCRYTTDAGRRHNELLAEAIRGLFAEWSADPRELARIVCCRGPGSFTGLRIGIATAKGIAAFQNLPVYAVPTLTAYRVASPRQLVISTIDGRKNRFYTELFEGRQSLFGPVDVEPRGIVDAISTLRGSAFHPFPSGKGSTIHVIGPDSRRFIEEIEAVSAETARRLEPDTAYFDGVAEALIACVRDSEDETTFLLDEASGPEYLRPSQAEE
ncbi:MAG: tRNA (adenosine(37)-N6)-threonylcarbamoyltransferase complex dimerization subunit type 1 TsaB [Spirochaetales bacterium]